MIYCKRERRKASFIHSEIIAKYAAVRHSHLPSWGKMSITWREDVRYSGAGAGTRIAEMSSRGDTWSERHLHTGPG